MKAQKAAEAVGKRQGFEVGKEKQALRVTIHLLLKYLLPVKAVLGYAM